MDNPLESVIENSVKEYARSKGWIAYKFTSPGRIGVPDALLFNPQGKPVMIEFKRKGLKLTARQMRELHRLQNQNVTALAVDNIELGKRIIDEYTTHPGPTSPVSEERD
jgi:VRR-NUC domain